MPALGTIALCIILTIILIVAGRYIGEYVYPLYWMNAPKGWRSTDDKDVYAQLDALYNSPVAGQAYGMWAGFFVGAAITAFAVM